MNEMLETYSAEGENVGSVEKSEIHAKMKDEYTKSGKVTLRHKDVKLIVLTSSGRIILQRRSKWKGDNPGKWDKTIGGHVTESDSFDLTMLKECAEELGIPATIVKPEEFEHTVQVTNLYVLGILEKLSYLDNFQSKREQANGTFWVEPSMTQFYIGYYDGAIRFIDKESCGIQVFTLKELEQEMAENPNAFTDDVKYIVEKFKDKIKPIEQKREHVLNI
jgi:isopentenyldiphosphate isomerase